MNNAINNNNHKLYQGCSRKHLASNLLKIMALRIGDLLLGFKIKNSNQDQFRKDVRKWKHLLQFTKTNGNTC